MLTALAFSLGTSLHYFVCLGEYADEGRQWLHTIVHFV